jgi:hypothetical protein
MEKIAIYRPTQLQAEIILKLAEGKGLEFYRTTKHNIQTGQFEESGYPNIIYQVYSQRFVGNACSESDLGNEYKLLSFIDFLAAIENHKETVKVNLTDQYQAELKEDGIKVGSLTIPYEKFDELKRVVEQYRKG